LVSASHAFNCCNDALNLARPSSPFKMGETISTAAIPRWVVCTRLPSRWAFHPAGQGGHLTPIVIAAQWDRSIADQVGRNEAFDFDSVSDFASVHLFPFRISFVIQIRYTAFGAQWHKANPRL
jgi:hypothetical protein